MIGIAVAVVAAATTGCTTTTVKTKATLASYQPVSDRLPSASEYWFHRDLEDRAAVARAISEGKGP